MYSKYSLIYLRTIDENTIFVVYLISKNMRAVIYARVSSINDRQSTDRQVVDLQKYAEQNNYEVAQVFEEHISGAKRNEDRLILCECLEYCISNKIDILLISELSRLGRNVDEVLANVKRCKDNTLNIYFQKENLSIFQTDGTKSPFLNIFISVLGTCAEMERDNIKFRLNSGRQQYIAKGGRLGRKMGSVKSADKKKEEYKDVLKALRQGLSVRQVAKLTDTSASTVQRLKKEFKL